MIIFGCKKPDIFPGGTVEVAEQPENPGPSEPSAQKLWEEMIQSWKDAGYTKIDTDDWLKKQKTYPGLYDRSENIGRREKITVNGVAVTKDSNGTLLVFGDAFTVRTKTYDMLSVQASKEHLSKNFTIMEIDDDTLRIQRNDAPGTVTVSKGSGYFISISGAAVAEDGEGNIRVGFFR